MNIDESISHTMAMLSDRAILAAAMLASCLGEVIALAHARFMPFRLRPFLQEDAAPLRGERFASLSGYFLRWRPFGPVRTPRMTTDTER